MPGRSKDHATSKGLALAAALALVGSWASTDAEAAGNLTQRATRLPPLVIDKELGLSVKSYELTTGTYYRWTIESKAGDEFRVVAPDLFANAWLEQVSINDIEVHLLGAISGIEFDDDGKAELFFIPIRPGEYAFGINGRPLAGKFVVR